MLGHSVDDITSWMAKTRMEVPFTATVRAYLLGQDSCTMKECLAAGSSTILSAAVESQDQLGWDCFVEGRISKVFLEVVANSWSGRRVRQMPERWCRIFIGKLLQLTHKQWLFRNSHVHYKKLDGLTEKQHEEIFERVKTLMWTDPGDLLAKHRYLLEEDFELLGEGSAGSRLLWIASMESARKAADHVRAGRQYTGNPGSFKFKTGYTTTLRPSQDGRFVYKRTRRKAK